MDGIVSVVVPIRNEEKYIQACLTSLLNQTYPSDQYEIIVADGRSSDCSKEIVEGFQKEHRNLICIDNPGATAPKGMNVGIRHAQGSIIIRADGHNIYPADYVANCVKYLHETGADNVGGPWLTVPATNTFSARLVAAMLSNPFGVGDSRFRITSADGFVETVPFGAYRRDLFDKIGFFNEKLVRNQDNELNARIRKAGGRIFQASALQTKYYPVASFKMLLKQTFKQSQWHIFSMKENFSAMGSRHFVPALFFLLTMALLATSFISKTAGVAGILLMALYLGTGLVFALMKSCRYGVLTACVLPFACFLFHSTYGLGTILGMRYAVVAPPSGPIRAGKPVGN